MSVYSISSAILFFTSSVFALVLYIADKKSKVIKIWVLESISVSLWGLSLYGVTTSNSEQQAIIWQYLLDVAATFVPVFYYLFVSILFNLKNRLTQYILIGIGVLVALFSFSQNFKIGVGVREEGYWITPGPYYVIFPIFISTIVLFSLITLARLYFKNKKDKKLRLQAIILFWGYVVASVSGITNFFPQLFNVYPYGNFFIAFYYIFMGYAILRFELLNLKIISTQLFSIVFGSAMFFNLLRSNSLEDWEVGFILFILVLCFGLLLIRSVKKEVEQREKIQALATDLSRANDRLKELDQMKTEFISLATHQIRAPLTSIKGYVSMIQEGDYGTVPKEILGALDIVLQSTNNLVMIVEDFLNVSRIEQNRMKYDFRTFNLEDLVNRVVTEYKPNVEKKGLKMNYEVDKSKDYTAYADEGKIKQVIGNIVDNSIKYTPQGHIDIKLIREPNDKYLVSVNDTGVGIDPKVMPKLFQKFSRASNANEVNILGTGLGLYVAKQMVQAHQGNIWAESEGEHKGSHFYVELPARSSIPQNAA